MSSLNTAQFDKSRIRHLLKLGIFAASLVMLGDVLLGWGVNDSSVAGIPLVLTRYLSVSDTRIIASALLGLIGIPVECLCWFAIYRLIRPYSESDAHLFRSGIIGCLAFGGCGVHVPCCIAVYLLKRIYAADPSAVYGEMLPWIGWFLVPATMLFLIFFILTAVVQLRAFAKGHTPYPKWCAAFSLFEAVAWVMHM